MGPNLWPSDPYERALFYCERVSSGAEACGRLERLGVERHLRDLEQGAERGLVFDEGVARRVLAFLELLRHSKGRQWAGKRFTLSPFQAFRNAVLFGWLNRETGMRRFRVSYNEVAKKNGKSTEAAGNGLYLVYADREPGAEVYTAATKRDQARIVHGEAVRMVKSSPALKRRLKVFKDNIAHEASHSKYEPLGADADTLDGPNVHAAIVDEVHAHKNRRLWDSLETAMAARSQPLMLAITTAGAGRESLAWELNKYSRHVLEGIIADDTWHTFLAAPDDDDDWRDPTIWRKGNPNLGITVDVGVLEQQYRRALEITSQQNAFRRYRLNQWTEQHVRWLDMEKYDRCAGPVTLEQLERDLAGCPAWAAMDLSHKHDLSAYVLAFLLDEGRVALVPRIFVPEDNVAERCKVDKVPYDTWLAEGHLIASPGDSIDYEFIRHNLRLDGERFAVQEVAADPWNALDMLQHLEREGFNVVQFRQGWASMSDPLKNFEAAVRSGRLVHCAHPVLRWCAANMSVRVDESENIRPDKKRSSERIDPLVAGVMAHARAMAQGGEGDSVYDSRGIVVL